MTPRFAWFDRFMSLFNRAEPTAPPRGRGGPALDLDRNRLGEVGIGDPLDSFRSLGPVEDTEAIAEGDYRYYSRGIWFSVTAGAVDSFGVFWRDIDRQGFQPFAGWVRFGSEQLALDGTTTEADFVERFAAPFWRDRDRNREVLLFYERGDVEWQVEFDRKSFLCAITVMSPPLLADPKQREMYRVTRDWPPGDS